ncbi:MAG: chemotaxis protein CheW [Candidatus Hydrogenedentes bacterium]|nr:chemotaxis protein CheW [Candidatus Hydrogenedentota bacterium]
MNSTEQLWVVFSLGTGLYAIPTTEVGALVRCGEVTPVPGAQSDIRGVVNQRGRVLPLIDLRVRLGLKSHHTETEELIETLRQREQDHKNWINELEASVRESREFKLTTNPHQCAFGRWYDAFRTDNLMLASLLKRFDEPHKAIHALGERVISMVKKGDVSGAQECIAHTRNTTLGVLIALFAQARDAMRESEREIAIVMHKRNSVFAVVVDAIESVERLSSDIQQIPAIGGAEAVSSVAGFARRLKHEGLVLLLDVQPPEDGLERGEFVEQELLAS